MKLDQKPDARERIKNLGAQTLSDHELVAVALRTGTKKAPVLTLAQRVTQALDSARGETLYRVLSGLDGVGETKAGVVVAALELGRRYSGLAYRKVQTAKDVYPLLQHYQDRRQEHFLTVSLSGAHEVIACRVVSMGILNRTLVHPREVFADPIVDRAAALIVCHNHPSGQLEASEEDRAITRRLSQAGEILGISLLDHIIITPRGGYLSFVEEGIPLS